MDANGILAVTAQDTVTGAKAGAEIKAKDGRLSADEIDKMVQDAEKHRAQDDELADKVTLPFPLALFSCPLPYVIVFGTKLLNIGLGGRLLALLTVKIGLPTLTFQNILVKGG